MAAAKALMSEGDRSVFDLNTNYFSLFSLLPDFKINLSELKESYLSLQQECHPDRYANGSEADQRQAVQQTAFLNQAYQTLNSPLRRAIYLLELQAVDFNPDSQTHTDTVFLMSQLELREQLEAVEEAADPFVELEQLLAKAEDEYLVYQDEFVRNYDAHHWNGAIEGIHKMMFASKFLEEIRLKEEVLDS